ncbi:hypothetical protein [Tahibacter amnicola]|uniref:Uncharacterized protein n=1 Tax=Tahibacter amnicola TaxID=2976241 RepID=A0ABY6BNB7_9GAMM|nr:hypothetical protein [Tahibacter amnicola]UXI70061.1 hypothetical protein N4264_10670 [Tahibacter amnicola]
MTNLLPGASDAWVAAGRPDVAVQQLLVESWRPALASASRLPMLREYTERAFGPGSYRREVEAALASIRITAGLKGLEGRMSLLGLSVPVPLGYYSSRDEEPRRFETPDEIARWLRPLLLPE